MTPLVKNIFRFFLFLAAQLLLKNQNLHNLVSPPYIYFIFLIWLPLGLPRKAEMLIAVFFGLCWDALVNQYGMHAAACLLIAYLRPYVLNFFMENKTIDYKGFEPNLKLFTSAAAYYSFIAILVCIHHLFLFLIQALQVGNVMHLLAKLFISILTSMLLIFIFELLMPRSQEAR